MKRIAIVAVATLALLILLPDPGGAAQGVLSCRASVVRIEGPVTLEPFVANPGYEPCVEDEAGLLSEQVAGVEVDVATARTTLIPAQNEGRAEAHVARVFIDAAGHQIGARVLYAVASACLTPTGQKHGVRGESGVAEVFIDGQAMPVGNQHLDIPLGGATLHLNHQTRETDPVDRERTLTQRALWLDTPAGDVIVAEAVADT
ncbi:MAG: choice-of-anchor P family protein [Actinomycetota bacterium]